MGKAKTAIYQDAFEILASVDNSNAVCKKGNGIISRGQQRLDISQQASHILTHPTRPKLSLILMHNP